MSGPVEAFYDLEATTLRVAADGVALMAGLDFMVGARRVAGRRAPSFDLAIRRGAPRTAPPEADILYSGPLLQQGDCVFARLGGDYLVTFPGAASLLVRPAARQGEIVAGETGLRHVRGELSALALEFAVDADGQCLVHCAGLSLPGGRALLVCAPSGTGKTTTALALARAGLPLASDDVMTLLRDGDGLCAWGLPRGLKVHRRTAAMLPWLEPALCAAWDEAGEQGVAREALKELIDTDDRRLRIAGIVLLKRGRDGETTALRPLPKTEMLAALAADNVRSAGGLTPLQARRFALLAEAVRLTPTCELAVAPGLAGLDVTLRSVLETTFEDRN